MSGESIFRDLLINNGDVVLDAGHSPTIATDRSVIAQDIAHAIIDSGLAFALIGDRGTGATADTISRMVLLVEDDLRIVPGTVKIEQRADRGKATYWVLADTYQFGPISSPLNETAE